MKNLLTYLILLIVAAGCGSETDDVLVEEDVQIESKYCKNQLELISAGDGFFSLEKELLLEQNFMQVLDSIIGEEYCELTVDMGIKYDLESKKFNSGPSTIPIKVKFDKTCSDIVRGCGYYNYMEVLYNSNYQILFEGEYTQMEELKKRIPQFFADIDSNYHEEPRKIFMTIHWDSGVELDSLSNLFGNVIDGYFETVSQYSLRRFDNSICNLSKTQFDTLKLEFPFNLKIPSYELVSPPVPLPPLPSRTNGNDILK